MQPILVTGASGRLGHTLARRLAAEGPVVGTRNRTPVDLPGVEEVSMDLADREQVHDTIRRFRPHTVYHTAALTDARACEDRKDLAACLNIEATAWLAEATAKAGARLVFVSTDLVFDGDRGWYREEDPPDPVSFYGWTKAEAEREVLKRAPGGIVVRLAIFYGPGSSGPGDGVRAPTFDEWVVACAEREGRVVLFEDEYRCPIHVEDAARALAEVPSCHEGGVLHLAGPDRVSRYEFGQALARIERLSPDTIVAGTISRFEGYPRRPADVSLDTSRLRALLASPPRGIEAGLAETGNTGGRP